MMSLETMIIIVLNMITEQKIRAASALHPRIPSEDIRRGIKLVLSIKLSPAQDLGEENAQLFSVTEGS